MTKKPKQSNRGGVREGAGRPPESPEGRRVYLNVKVLPSTLQRIKNLAGSDGSQGKVIDRLVDLA